MNAAEARSVLAAVDYRRAGGQRWDWEVAQVGKFVHVRAAFHAPNNYRPDQQVYIKTRTWLLDADSTERGVLQTALLCVLQANEHEAREEFKVCGLPVFGPHGDGVEQTP